jgi:TonB-linked SusC/RagA family outer membrane protein
MKKLLRMYLGATLLLLLGLQIAQAQNRKVTGKVTDANSSAGLPGVSVSIKGTAQGAVTDGEGKYSVNVGNNATLLFSFVGYKPQSIEVGNRSSIDIALAEDVTALQEVVAVGYGLQKKSQLTGAISSVSAKQISEMPVTSLGQAIQGRVAGVDVAQSGSKPGSVPQILIRGRRSFLAGNDPLYVVDGIPLAAGYEDINPNDIQSLEILKDATATAIYGSRGANGVVLVTTKRGAEKGKTTITYDTYIGQTQALDKIRLFNSTEFAEYVREAYRSTGLYKDANGNIVPTGTSDTFADSKIAVLGGDPAVVDGLANNRNTDWQNLILRKGFIQNHTLGIQGGNDKTQFYISGNYFKEEGITKGLDFTRYSLRANIDHKINKTFRTGISSYMMYSERNGENQNYYGSTLQQNPLANPYNADGSIKFQPTNDALLYNPLADVAQGAIVDETKKYRIFNSIFLETKIADGLTYRLNFGPDLTISRSGLFTGSMTGANKAGSATGSVANAFRFNWTLENIINYSKVYKDVHSINVTALQSIQKDNFEASNLGVSGIPAETQLFYNLGNASAATAYGSNLIQWTINSFMGRINYAYKDKYLLTATIRRDGSSRFGENNKYGTFPGVALGWNITNEPFMKDYSWVNLLKLRASVASVGNTGVAPYQTQGLLGRTTYAWGSNAAYGYRPYSIGNPDLRWENSSTKNIGLDFSLWRGKVQGSIEYYVTNTTDLIMADNLPGTVGVGNNVVTKNVGETQNKGIEISIGTVNIDKGGFKWSTDFTFMKNTESIVALYNGAVDDIGNRWFIGQPLGVVYDFKKLGIWQTNEADQAKLMGSSVGQIKVQDTNGDGKINADDMTILGSNMPSWSGGITNRFSYKGFDLSFFVFARVGQWIVSGFHRDLNQLAGRYEQMKVDYWTPNNPTNEFPQPKSTQEFPVNRGAIINYDGSFVKVRNINFGYTFPSSVTKRLGIESLRLFTSIQQPFIWSSYRTKYNGVDPETQTGTIERNVTPAVMTTTVGLNAKF